MPPSQISHHRNFQPKPQNPAASMSAAAQNLLTNPRLHHLFQTHPNRPKPLFSNLPIRPCRKPYPLEIPSHYSPDSKLHSFKTSQWQIRVFQSAEGINNRQINKLNLDTFLSVAEVLCIAPSAVFSIGCALNSVISWAPQKSLQVSLGNRFFVWQFVFLAGAVVIGALIRQRQWQRICRDTVDYGGLNIIERIEKLEEDLRNSATIVRVLSRQLEKLGIRFRVTRKSLKDPITEAAALAQKNSEATRALAMQEEILERELGEIQKVLLAMQEQQQKQLELILAIGKSGKLRESRLDSTAEDQRIETRHSVPGKEQMKQMETQKGGRRGSNNDKI